MAGTWLARSARRAVSDAGEKSARIKENIARIKIDATVCVTRWCHHPFDGTSRTTTRAPSGSGVPLGRPTNRRRAEAGTESPLPAPCSARSRVALPVPRHAQGPSRCAVAPHGSTRSGVRAQPAESLRARALPRLALQPPARPRSPHRGSDSQAGSRLGHEVDRFTAGTSREPGLRAAGTCACRPLPPPCAVHAERGEERPRLRPVECKTAPGEAGRPAPAAGHRSRIFGSRVRRLALGAGHGPRPASGLTAPHLAAELGLAASRVDPRGRSTQPVLECADPRSRSAQSRRDRSLHQEVGCIGAEGALCRTGELPRSLQATG